MASMGKVLFPKHATWKADVLGQALRFPVGKHDDAVDVLSLIGRGLELMPSPEKAFQSANIEQPAADGDGLYF